MGNATLTDNTKTFVFPLPPETIMESIVGEYAANMVLDTTAPNVRRKAAGTTIKLGRCLFISRGLSVDQTVYLSTLRFWSKNQTKLKFAYNRLVLPVCYIKSINIDAKQYRNGKPVHIEIDLELMEASQEVKTVTLLPAKKITPREQKKKVDIIKSKLKNPSILTSLGLSEGYTVDVTDLAQVNITSDDNVNTYDYDDLMGRLS